MEQYIVPGILISVTSFFLVLLTLPVLIKFLERRNQTVRDVNKPNRPMIARPGGPSIVFGLIISESILFYFFQLNEILALIFTTSMAFIVGYIDDRRVMDGWFKPLALAISSVPIILLGAYDPNLTFPLFGDVKIPLLYLALIAFMIPVTGNTLNSIDVMNGVVSSFMIIASSCLTISLFILQNYEIALASLPLVFSSLAFYKFHKLPSKIFPGDSGALTFGAMYGTLAIIGSVEIIAAIALLPAVINSFLFLSSVKRIVEHRQINSKPVEHTNDFKLKATSDKLAPVTLVRLILANGPLTEKQICQKIQLLALFSGILAIITAFFMDVKIW